MPSHPLINFETQKCCQKNPNLPRMKDGAYVINID